MSEPTKPPRYSPPVEADAKPGSGRVISRPAPTPDRKPGDTPSLRPAPRNGDGGEVVRAKPRGTPLDDRYRPTKPAPTNDASKPQPVAQPVAQPRRPASGLPPTSTRYRPSDTSSPAPATRRPVPIAGSSAGSVATPVRKPNTTAPNLAPRSGAPRLSAPRANARPITSAVVSSRYQRATHGSHCHRSYWHGYWDPCHDTWGHCHTWGFGSGCGSFGWRMSFYYPLLTCRSLWWNHCYHDTLWYSWSNPYCTSTSYWWYPGTVYCPSYLYVPSTVVVYETSAPEAAPAGGSSEVVVAGGGVVGSARSIEAGPGTESLAQSLAVKYVELGDFYFRAGRYDDAAEAYGKARSYTPDDASVHFVLADAVFATGGWHYAAFLIAEGLRLEPALASATTDKRTFYGNAADFDAQMAALDSYLDKNAYDAQAMLVRGYNLAFSQRPADARVAFDRVLAIEPENRAAALFAKALRPAPEKAPSVF